MSTSTGPARVLRVLLIVVAVLAASLTVGGLSSPASATGTGKLNGQVSLPSFWATGNRPADTRITITLYRWTGSSFVPAGGGTYQPTPQDLNSNTFSFSQEISATDYYAVSFSSPAGPYALPTTWIGGNPAPSTATQPDGTPTPGVYRLFADQSITVQGTQIEDVLYGNGRVVDANGNGFVASVQSFSYWQGVWSFYAATQSSPNGDFAVPMRPGHSMSFVVYVNGTAVSFSGGGSTFPNGPGAGGTYYYINGGNVFVGTLNAYGVNAGGGGGNGGGTVHPTVKSKSYIQYRLTNAGLHPGAKAKFKVKISGPAGIPTGQVTLKTVSGKLLGVANLRHDGTAMLRSYSLPRGYYYVKIRYKGSDAYQESKTKKIYFCVD